MEFILNQDDNLMKNVIEINKYNIDYSLEIGLCNLNDFCNLRKEKKKPLSELEIAIVL
jgi:hypothetical protein